MLYTSISPIIILHNVCHQRKQCWKSPRYLEDAFSLAKTDDVISYGAQQWLYIGQFADKKCMKKVFMGTNAVEGK